jgi:hypothetical protein
MAAKIQAVFIVSIWKGSRIGHATHSPFKVKEIEQAAIEIVKITQREASINKQSSKE